jgi:hypothetical protein
MISRRTTYIISDIFEEIFTHQTRRSQTWITKVYKDYLYDFLYKNNYPAWLCNASRQIYDGYRGVKNFIMKLHTGETQLNATPNWNWTEREKLGQQYLINLSKDILNYISKENKNSSKEIIELKDELISNLELDGFIHKDNNLLSSEDNILNTEEETNILKELYKRLNLDNQQTAFHHLGLSEKHYLEKKWDDSISNARKFLECTLQEVANAYSQSVKKTQLPPYIYSKPVNVRDYLEKEKVLEIKEKKAISEIYSLLSKTGGHPYIAKNDQARLLRNLALTISQFVILRYEGILKVSR